MGRQAAHAPLHTRGKEDFTLVSIPLWYWFAFCGYVAVMLALDLEPDSSPITRTLDTPIRPVDPILVRTGFAVQRVDLVDL